jgi:hypothetical protein
LALTTSVLTAACAGTAEDTTAETAVKARASADAAAFGPRMGSPDLERSVFAIADVPVRDQQQNRYLSLRQRSCQRTSKASRMRSCGGSERLCERSEPCLVGCRSSSSRPTGCGFRRKLQRAKVSSAPVAGGDWWDWTADVWSPNSQDEIMAFTSWSGTTAGSWGTQIASNVTIDGVLYASVWQANPGWHVLQSIPAQQSNTPQFLELPGLSEIDPRYSARGG